MLKKKYVFILCFLLSCFSVSAQSDEIECTLSFSDRTLDVKIGMPANDFDKTSFSLSDWAGQANYAENIYRVSATDKLGNPLNLEKKDARSWVVENLKKPFEISYTVVAQKDAFVGNKIRNHFHPTIFKDYVFLWGVTVLLFPDDEKLVSKPVKLRVIQNEYAKFYTNFDEKSDSFSDLSELFIAAGNYRVVEKNIGGRNVKFLLQGKDWKFTDEQFSDAVSRIIDAQTKYIGFSPSDENLLITLTEGAPGSRGGTVVKNVISVYPDPQSGLNDFETLKLISHEHFHFWNGGYWHASENKKEGYYKWMSEGFTEYYAGLTLYRENLVTEKEFIAWLNRLLLEYQINPHALTATAEILAEKYWESNDYNRLPYIKGALVAFLTDSQLRQKTSGAKQIDDLMKLLISRTDRKKGYDDRTLLESFAAVSETKPAPENDKRRIFSRRFYDDYMLGAKFLPFTEVLKNSNINVSERPREVFDLGFITESGRIERGAKIKQVTTQSAIDAGLKQGDELRGFSFNYGRPEDQASITVSRADKTIQIKYFPKKTMNVFQISDDAKIPK